VQSSDLIVLSLDYKILTSKERVMNADGSGKTILTGSIGQSLFPVFTPDGSKILYQHLSGGECCSNWDLILMNADGSNPIGLTNQNRFLAW